MRRDQLFAGDAGTRIGTRAQGESGYIFAMMGLLMVPLVIMTAFAVDLGSWYAQGQRMQRVADAASLAGVVWAQQPTQWDTVARETASRNGYTDGVDGVSVDVVRLAANQIRVTIRADGEQYFSKIVLPTGERLTRKSTAEYVLPVPLGSPRNYIGTGSLGNGTGAYEQENLWAAISGLCTDKVQGDRKAAQRANLSGNNTCSGTNNSEYSNVNYAYYLELPEERTYATDVILYHANMVQYLSDPACGNANQPAEGPLPNEFCPGGIDSRPLMPTTFTLYEADDTDLDDSDNDPMSVSGGCTSGTGTGTRTFAGRTPTQSAETNYTFAPAGAFENVPGWYQLCQIPASAPGGKYILTVNNTSSTTTNANGSNAFSIVATPSSPQRLCDSRTDTTCPRVYAREFLSIYAKGGGTPEFFLAEIGPEHKGKKVRIQLWDSAEGASEIRIKRPIGTNSWTDETFSWSTTGCSGGGSGTNVTNINVASFNFNGCLVTIEYTLPTTYSPPTDNSWWRIRYNYAPGATDRTTWSVNILGDPVHIIE
jgi:hypothetical protein